MLSTTAIFHAASLLFSTGSAPASAPMATKLCTPVMSPAPVDQAPLDSAVDSIVIAVEADFDSEAATTRRCVSPLSSLDPECALRAPASAPPTASSQLSLIDAVTAGGTDDPHPYGCGLAVGPWPLDDHLHPGFPRPLDEPPRRG